MNTLELKNTVLQPGRPKVAVPIVGKTPEEIIEECRQVAAMSCDMIEWRADYYLSAFENLDEHLTGMDAYLEIIKILEDINLIAGDKPVIFTVRKKKEGGMVDITKAQADSLFVFIAQSQLTDLIDIELFDDDDTVDEIGLGRRIAEIHSYGGKVILSYHDFNRMPKPIEIVNLVRLMKKLGADVCKIAAMSYSQEDVENMLKTSAVLTKKGQGPLIMTALGELGKTARIAAGRYGSCISFASGMTPSAPGQMNTDRMKNLLDKYYG